MRFAAISLLGSLLLSPALIAADIEYGHTYELKGVERVHVWTDKDDALRKDIEGRLKEALPALSIVETEQECQVVFAVKRRTAKEDAVDPNLRYVTTGSVIRPLSETRIRLIIDLVSKKPEMADATGEITAAFVNELKKNNPKVYGPPDKNVEQDTKQFRSMAGLRAGLSKKDVLAAVGPPTRVEGKGTMSESWWYETTDGTFRLLFQGYTLMQAKLLETKKK